MNSPKLSILSDLWELHRTDEGFEMFIEYNDIGLPLAYFIKQGLVTDLTDEGWNYIDETFDMFLAALGFDKSEITEGTTLTSLLEIAASRQQ